MKRIVIIAVAWLGLSIAAVAQTNSGGGSGAAGVTSIATACGVSGGTITTTGTIQGNASANAQTGTTYTLASSDCGKFVTFSNAASIAVTIPIASTSGFGAGYFATLINEGSGTVTLTPTTSTIDGAASLTLTTNQSVDLYSDGTNYFTSRGRGASSGANPTATASDTAVNGSASTFMRSDGAPAVQKGTNAQFGLAEGDNITLSMAAGVASTKAGTINHPIYQSTLWYPPRLSGQSASGAPSLTTAYCAIYQIGGNASVSITALALRSTANAGNIQLAIYNNDTSSGISRPGTLIGATANIVATTLGNLSGALSGGPFSANPGFYWFCMQTDSTLLRYLYPAQNATDLTEVSFSGSATLANAIGSVPMVGISTTTGVTGFGTWPSFVGATFTEITNTAPIIAFQVQ